MQPLTLILSVVLFISCTSKTSKEASTKQSEPIVEKINNTPHMVKIKGGYFEMGSTVKEADEDEYPVHKVFVDDFEIDVYEATQREFKEILGDSVKFLKDCLDCPADFVSWKQADDYCKKQGKRLPTEAEWEYAARGGTQTNFYWGDEVDVDYLWYFDNSEVLTHPVGMKKPNAYGLYDMSGNVWEWVSDFYDPEYFKESPIINPKGPESGERKVTRGGSWEYQAKYQRSANRRRSYPDFKLAFIGCRCVK